MLIHVKPKHVYFKQKSLCNFSFKYSNTVLDIVDTLNYLGITFYYSGNFRTACKVLAEQAMKS